ncbi:hypothetical protein RhiLY_09084 [Ceratobasidium sp. AG-Ba]|nr:hypothetical protein RhiLY_09084 [Ceratobasidium sp. AG-Ba]
MAADRRPSDRIPSRATARTIPVLASSFHAPSTLPPPPSVSVSFLAHAVQRASKTRSWLRGTRHELSMALCRTRPPLIRSRLVFPAYYTLFVVQRELCGPQLSFLGPVLRPSYYTPFCRAALVAPDPPPLATRVVSANIPPTRVWSLAIGNPPPPQPAYARAHGRSCRVEGTIQPNDNTDYRWEGIWRLGSWGSVGFGGGFILVLILGRLKRGSWLGWKREPLFAAPPESQTPVSRPTNSPNTPLAPHPIPATLQAHPATPAQLSWTSPDSPSTVPPPPPPPPPPPEDSVRRSPDPPPQYIRQRYMLEVGGYRGEHFFGEKVWNLETRGRKKYKARLENDAWELMDGCLAWLEGRYRAWSDAHFKARVSRETELYELRRKPNGRFAWTKASHESQTFDSMEEFMASVERIDQRNAWCDAFHWLAQADRTPSRPQSPLGPPALDEQALVDERRIVVEDDDLHEGVDLNWEDRV